MTFGTSLWHRIRELYTSRHEPEYLRPLAESLWRGLLVLSVAGVIAVVVFGTWEFWSVLDYLNPSPAGGKSAPAALNRVALEKTLAVIAKKQQAFEMLKSNATPVVDPSK